MDSARKGRRGGFESLVVVILTALALDGCSGGAAALTPKTVATLAPSIPQHSGGSAPTGSIAFSIVVPGAATSASDQRRRAYVSVATASLRFAVSGRTNDVIAHVAYGATGCTASPSDGPLRCTTTVPAPIGAADTVTVSSYAAEDAAGTPLATTRISVAVAARVPTAVALDLDGVVSGIALSPSWIHLVADGTHQSLPIAVVATDAAGAIIVGKAAFAAPIDVRLDGDVSAALRLDRASLGAPGGLTLSYDSNRPLDRATVIATSGTTKTTANVTVLSAKSVARTYTIGGNAAIAATVHESGVTDFSAYVLGGDVAVNRPPLSSGMAVAVSPSNAGDATITLTPPTQATTFHYDFYGPAGVSLPVEPYDGLLDINDGFNAVYVPVSLVAPSLPHETVATVPGATWPDFPFIANLVAGPDGNPWFVTAAADGSLKMAVADATTGTTTLHALPTGFGTADAAGNITEPTPATVVGPDGNLWFGTFTQGSLASSNGICRFDVRAFTTTCYATGLTSSIIPAMLAARGNSVLFIGSVAPDDGVDLARIDVTSGAISRVAPFAPQPPLNGSFRSVDGKVDSSTNLFPQPSFFTSDKTARLNDGSAWIVYFNNVNLSFGRIDLTTGAFRDIATPCQGPLSFGANDAEVVYFEVCPIGAYYVVNIGSARVGMNPQDTAIDWGDGSGQFAEGPIAVRSDGKAVTSLAVGRATQRVTGIVDLATLGIRRYATPPSLADADPLLSVGYSFDNTAGAGGDAIAIGNDMWVVYRLYDFDPSFRGAQPLTSRLVKEIGG